MGDMKDFFNSLSDEQKLRRKHQKVINTKIIENSGMKYRSCNDGETLLFKTPKSCEFFPSSGKWTVHKPRRSMFGGAEEFLKWLKG